MSSSTGAEPVASLTDSASRADVLARAAAALQAGRAGEAAGICHDILRGANVSATVRAAAQRLRDDAAARIGGLHHAIDLLEWSTRANPGQPDWLGILMDLYRRADRLDDALATAGEIARLHPGRAASFLGLARVHADRCDAPAATSAFHAALALEPANAVAHFGLAQMLLLQGDYRPGWAEYEWRHKLGLPRTVRPPSLPQWNGMKLPQGRLLLYNDQGFGDGFQFARYIPWAAARVGQVSLHSDPAGLSLFRTLPCLAEVSDDWNELTEKPADGAIVQTSLASLPGLAGTLVETIPVEVPYLIAPPDRVRAWAQTLSQRLPGGKFRIGLAWAGNQAPPGDPRRAVPVADLAGLAAVPGIALVSLQKTLRAGDAPPLRVLPNLLDLAPDLTDFGETAAVIANLDLVISICSGVTHLAGALGCPVWVMLARPADWRWLTGRDDSPWYPTARLFRQTRSGVWSDVVAAIAAELPAIIMKTSRS